jgi:hypothetical protein
MVRGSGLSIATVGPGECPKSVLSAGKLGAAQFLELLSAGTGTIMPPERESLTRWVVQ